LRRVGAVKLGEAASLSLMRGGINDLNDILREEDNDLTGEKAALWALSSRHIFLEADHRIYTADDDLPDGIPENLMELMHAFLRDTTGADTPIGIYSPREWERLTPKNETGDPQGVYLEKAISLPSQKLFVWPIPSVSSVSAGETFGTVSEVTGTDGEYYDCIFPHTSSAQTRPVTGQDWPLFWQRTGTTGATWVTATDYTTGRSIRLQFKRPLYDFDGPDDDPDLPAGWASYLLWRLCITLASGEEFRVSDENFQRFLKQLEIATTKLFPTKIVKSTDYHNKARYF